MATRNYYQTTATPKPVQVVPANVNRITLAMKVIGATGVYIGKDGSLTAQNGFPIVADDGMVVDDVPATDAIWVITSAGAGDFRVMEITN